MKQKQFLVLSLTSIAILAAGCQPSGDPKPSDDGSAAAAMALTIGHSVVESSGAIAALTSPFSSTVASATDDEESAQTGVESAITGSLVTDPTCVSLTWTLLRAAVDFDNCTIVATGETLDGSISLTVRIINPRVTLSFEQLTLGQNSFFGSISAYAKGPIGAVTVGVEADMTLSDSETTMDVDELGIAFDATGVTLAGSSSVVGPTVDSSAALEDLRFERGDCLPSSGAIAFSNTSISGQIVFTAATPSTGEVELQIDPFPAQTTQMFSSCR